MKRVKTKSEWETILLSFLEGLMRSIESWEKSSERLEGELKDLRKKLEIWDGLIRDLMSFREELRFFGEKLEDFEARLKSLERSLAER